jgi:plasmid maintenance system antidote protein VapI
MKKYILKEEKSNEIKSKYKSTYIANGMDLSNAYVSLIIHRKKTVPKKTALSFTKIVDNDLEVSDLFEVA